MDLYQHYVKQAQYFKDVAYRLNKKIKQLMSIRLSVMVLVLFFFIYSVSSDQLPYLYLSLILLIAFLILLRQQNKLEVHLQYLKAQSIVYQQDIDFLSQGTLPKHDGKEYIQSDHPYTFDLDVFGPHSLFQYLNRTQTQLGEQALVQQLNHQNTEHIEEKQEVIQELSEQIDWIKEMQAHAYLTQETQEKVQRLMSWLDHKKVLLPRWVLLYSKISWLPILTLGILQYFTVYDFTNYLILGVFLNLSITTHFKKKNHLIEKDVDYMGQHIRQYAILFQKIETIHFKSQGLKNLQQVILKNQQQSASSNLFLLTRIFKRFENIQNVFGNILLNGVSMYHIQSLHQTKEWHKHHNLHLQEQLEAWAHLEAFMSLALFKAHHPNYQFPTIGNQITFQSLGHPLMDQKKMVTNDVSLANQPFMILTGSNMSGKSTFLRSLGTNYLLFSLGAPIYAKKATLIPLPLFVSMRQTDSLSDSESYFYAEIKRLKSIKDALSVRPHFILLDEILRGTNSDDKTNGAIGLLEQLSQLEVFGVMATHDLEVCDMANKHPHFYKNYCFESQIIDDDLYFDYQLHPGICKNRSATFLMKKMGILPH